jgi:hypothetical protein
MSLHSQPIPAIPEETVRVAHAVLPEGNVWLQMRDELGTLYENEDFADLFPSLCICQQQRGKNIATHVLPARCSLIAT